MRTAEVAVQAALRNQCGPACLMTTGVVARLPGGSDGGRPPRARRSVGRLAVSLEAPGSEPWLSEERARRSRILGIMY